MEEKDKKIIFFDGVCNLCNGFIDYVISRNKKKNIYYSSLQSETAERILRGYNIDLNSLSTIYYYDGKKLYNKSSAVLRIFRELSTFHKIFSWFCFIIPPFLRDIVYNYIAKNRYKFFGKKETCRLPSPEEKNQFI